VQLKDVTIARTTICQQTKGIKPVKVCAACPNRCPRVQTKVQTVVSIQTKNKPRSKKRMTPAQFDAAFLRALRISWNNDERTDNGEMSKG
jgi:hypothetical protein